MRVGGRVERHRQLPLTLSLWTLYPSPYTLHPEPYTLHSTPSTLHSTPHTLHAPCTPHPPPSTQGEPCRTAERLTCCVHGTHPSTLAPVGEPHSQETPATLGPPQVPRYRATVGSHGGGGSYERGSPVTPNISHQRDKALDDIKLTPGNAYVISCRTIQKLTCSIHGTDPSTLAAKSQNAPHQRDRQSPR